jgi:hypothetical protein
MMEGPGADSEEKHEPVSDIDTAVVVVCLKALDPEWPIREAIGGITDMAGNADTRCRRVRPARWNFIRTSAHLRGSNHKII